jgi:hypothetical protein
MHAADGRDRNTSIAALAALLVLPGCPLTDNYFVDPGRGDAGNGGASAGGGGDAGTGGNSKPDAATGGNGGAATGGTGGAGNGGTATPDAARGGAGGVGGAGTGGAGGVGGAGTGGAGTGGASGAGTGGTGASDAATDADDSGNCNTGSCMGTCCGSLCVDLQTNPLRCGACTVACSAGQSCVAGACKGGWGPIAPPPPGFAAREKAGYTVFDSKLFIFGGADSNDMPLGDGAIYDPATNTWKVVSVNANTPSPRRFPTIVWTGSRILVYGGRPLATSAGLANGAIYDPDVDRWSPITNGVTGRVGAVGGASTSVALFWGGWGAMIANPMGGGERYDLGTDAWQPIMGGPGALADPAWAFTGQALYLFGGMSAGTKTNATWSYGLASNAWTQPGGTEGPSARWGAFATWDGLAMFVWGGRNETTAMNDGKFLYNSSWISMVQSGSAPAPRWAPSRRSGWAFSRGSGDVVILGGEDFNGKPLTDGGRYDSGLISPVAGWTALPAWPSGEAHSWGVAAYAGGAVLLWGGRHGTLLTTTGERWAP